ncbi:phage virion morphogenesis protein [Alloalcanivorax xenomutans]|uniref:phage virion morphogenesis protein n=1 Tax=Alloalcanivorax xenomutans TaxID=1094342 RepID=UPI0006D5B8C6|nr:phage virion morphogenesis protein [Alloalcanivorax xenomutans]CUR45509.1 phage virion morphogenesis protein [Alloalcanivorax xenomutans]
MSGVVVDVRGMAPVQRFINRLANPDLRALADSLGAELESQTRRRIAEEKTAPDGSPWAPWSAVHAATRHAGHSLLQGDGDLLDSVTYQVSGTQIRWGSPLVYAGVMREGASQGQFGTTRRGGPIPWGDIPGREFLGLSAENEDDLVGITEDWLQELMP